MNKISAILMLSLFWVLALTAGAHAHKVSIFAWVEGDTVHTQSKFSGGRLVHGGKVEVFDAGGARLLEGQTDAAGQFSFKPPRIADLDIVLTAGMGHQHSWKLAAAELGPDVSPPAPAAPAAAPLTDPLPPPAEALTAGQIEAIVSRQLEKHIQPLTRMIAASRPDGPAVSDILGGLGYILGMVGLGAVIRYRRENRKP